MKLSLPQKLMEKLVSVPVISFCKIFISSYWKAKIQVRKLHSFISCFLESDFLTVVVFHWQSFQFPNRQSTFYHSFFIHERSKLLPVLHFMLKWVLVGMKSDPRCECVCVRTTHTHTCTFGEGNDEGWVLCLWTRVSYYFLKLWVIFWLCTHP
jgi:hypothetical protein